MAGGLTAILPSAKHLMKNSIRVAVILIIAIAGLFYFRWYHQWNNERIERQPRSVEVNCVNNLKQLGLGFRIWEGDHGDRLPFNVGTNEGGTLELTGPDKDGYVPNAYLFLRCMSNELTRPIILVCPQDKTKIPAADWAHLTGSNVSYRFYSATNKILAICPIDGNVLYSDGTVMSTNNTAGEQDDRSGQIPMQVKLPNNSGKSFMKLFKIILATAVVAVIVVLLLLINNRSVVKVSAVPLPKGAVASVGNAPVNVSSNAAHHLKVKTKYSEFTDAEKAEFHANFENRYKPALSNWCKIYGDHVPFSRWEVTADKLAERVGMNTAYREFVFVVDGITVGIQDANGAARVDYLNDPSQTRKMAMQPDGTAPIIVSPVPRTDVMTMLAFDSGTQFPPDQVKLVPSGFSGGLNGGVMVHVGGIPNNAATWKYDMVFGGDGKLAYYLNANH